MSIWKRKEQEETNLYSQMNKVERYRDLYNQLKREDVAARFKTGAQFDRSIISHKNQVDFGGFKDVSDTGFPTDINSLNKMINIVKQGLNEEEQVYKYMQKNTRGATKHVLNPLGEVFSDIIEPTDAGDLVSAARVGIGLLGPGSEVAMSTVAIAEAAVSVGDATLDQFRRAEEGRPTGAKTFATDWALSWGSAMTLSILGRGAKKYFHDTVRDVMRKGLDENTNEFMKAYREYAEKVADPYVKDPLGKHTKTVGDHVDDGISKGVGAENYGKQLKQVDTGEVDVDLDAYTTGTSPLDEVVTKTKTETPEIIKTKKAEEVAEKAFVEENKGLFDEAKELRDQVKVEKSDPAKANTPEVKVKEKRIKEIAKELKENKPVIEEPKAEPLAKIDLKPEPKVEVPVEPKADIPVEPKADIPVEPKADIPVEPKVNPKDVEIKPQDDELTLEIKRNIKELKDISDKTLQELLDGGSELGRTRGEYSIKETEIVGKVVRRELSTDNIDEVFSHYVNKYPELKDLKLVRENSTGIRKGEFRRGKITDLNTKEVTSVFEIAIPADTTEFSQDFNIGALRHEIQHALDFVNKPDIKTFEPSLPRQITESTLKENFGEWYNKQFLSHHAVGTEKFESGYVKHKGFVDDLKPKADIPVEPKVNPKEILKDAKAKIKEFRHSSKDYTKATLKEEILDSDIIPEGGELIDVRGRVEKDYVKNKTGGKTYTKTYNKTPIAAVIYKDADGNIHFHDDLFMQDGKWVAPSKLDGDYKPHEAKMLESEAAEISRQVKEYAAVKENTLEVSSEEEEWLHSQLDLLDQDTGTGKKVLSKMETQQQGRAAGKLELPIFSTTENGLNQAYTARRVNRYRQTLIEQGVERAENLSDKAIMKMIKNEATINELERLVPQYNRIIREVRAGNYGNIVDVKDIANNDYNIQRNVFPIIMRLETQKDISKLEVEDLIAKHSGSEAVNDILDLLLYADKNNLDLSRGLYDPRTLPEGSWVRELMLDMSSRYKGQKQIFGSEPIEFWESDDIFTAARKKGVAHEIFEQIEDLNTEASSVGKVAYSIKDLEDIGDLGSLKAKILAPSQEALAKQYSIISEISGDPLVASKIGSILATEYEGKQLGQLTYKEFEEGIWYKLFDKGTKGKAKATKAFREIREAYKQDKMLSKELIRNIEQSVVRKKRALNQLPLYANKEEILAHRDIIGVPVKGRVETTTKAPKGTMSKINQEQWEQILPDVNQSMKAPRDVLTEEWGHTVKFMNKDFDMRSTTMGQIRKSANLEEVNEIAEEMFRQQLDKTGKITIDKVGSFEVEDIVAHYTKKYGIKDIPVHRIVDPERNFIAAVEHLDTTGEVSAIIVNDHFYKTLTAEKRAGVARHEVEHLIDLEVRSPLWRGDRGNTPSVYVDVDSVRPGTILQVNEATGIDGNVSDFVAKHREFVAKLNDDTTLDEVMGMFYDDHFYNYTNDTFERSYVKHNAEKYLEEADPTNSYWEFLNDLKESTNVRGSQYDMNDLMLKYFKSKDEFERFMFKFGGGQSTFKDNTLGAINAEAEVRALGMRKGQYLYSLNTDSILKNRGVLEARGISSDAVITDMKRLLDKQRGLLQEVWAGGRAQFADVEYTPGKLLSDVIVNSIIGFGGQKEMLSVPFQIVERLQAGGAPLDDVLREYLKAFPSALGNYGKSHAYSLGSCIEAFVSDIGGKDLDSVYIGSIAKKLQEIGSVVKSEAGSPNVVDLHNTKKLLNDLHSYGKEQSRFKKKANAFMLTSLSGLEQGDTLGAYMAREKVIDDFKKIASVAKYEDLNDIQKRMLGIGGYNEEVWEQAQSKVKKYIDLEGFDFDTASWEHSDIASMFHEGTGYYNRVAPSRKLTKLSPTASHAMFLMKTTAGMADNTWKEISHHVDKGILVPNKGALGGVLNKNTLKKMRFMIVASGFTATAMAVPSYIEDALARRENIVDKFSKELDSFDDDWAAKSRDWIASGVYASSVGATFSSGGGTAIAAGTRMLKRTDTPQELLDLTLSAVVGGVTMRKWKTLTGSKAEKEKKMQSYLRSDAYRRDVDREMRTQGRSHAASIHSNYKKHTNYLRRY